MSRRLPARPNLEDLKKQAKASLREARQHTPLTRLSDVQHALAREYGFATWPALRAHVEALITVPPSRVSTALSSGAARTGCRRTARR